jgi:hypothetical protein
VEPDGEILDVVKDPMTNEKYSTEQLLMARED